ncbi:hypothetical protein REPUB_Repub20aG0062800 [Reevesia pubescens]
MSAIAGSYGYIALGSRKHVNRRGAVADGSSAVSDGKPGKRANASGYGSHEELVSSKLKYHYGGGSGSNGDFGGDGLMVRFVDEGCGCPNKPMSANGYIAIAAISKGGRKLPVSSRRE